MSRDPCGRWSVSFAVEVPAPVPPPPADSVVGVDLARAHRKVRASRADFLHRTSARLVRDHDVIVIEDLAVKNMIRNHSLAKAISDSSWGEFRRQLQYKAARAGRHLIVIDRFYPSRSCRCCLRS